MRTAGDANNWCFASAYLATTLPVDLMGRVFSFENANYVIGESAGLFELMIPLNLKTFYLTCLLYL